MLKCRIKCITEFRRKTVFINPKCGHIQEFEYSLPLRCQNNSCLEEVTQVNKLYGINNQNDRIKFYIEGKL